MRIMNTIFAAGVGLAALAAAPASAQYAPYGYTSPYAANPYGYNNYAYGGVNTSAATQQCEAAVQNRLYNRTSLGSILGSMVGLPTSSYGRVVGVTRITPTRYGMTVRGVASSGRVAYNNYGPYGVGAYGGLGYGANQAADLSFRCDVDYRGFVRNVDIHRRY